MNKKVLLPKMAVTGIRKNAGMYLPYILTTSFSAAVYLIFSCIIQNKMLESAPYAMYLMMLLQIGKVLLGLILLPFLFYTNSFLVKKRKKEFGLYHILGLGKKTDGCHDVRRDRNHLRSIYGDRIPYSPGVWKTGLPDSFTGIWIAGHYHFYHGCEKFSLYIYTLWDYIFAQPYYQSLADWQGQPFRTSG